MQIGFNAPTTGPLIEPDSLARIVMEGEALGFDYVTISDHIMVPRNLQSKYPYTGTGEFPAGASAAWLEQLTTTAYVAGLTKKLRFVLSVMVVPHRPAVLTAKVLSTIDYLSKGRLTLGIGVGWCREEFEAIGAAPFDDRGNVTDEWMAACQELWSPRRRNSTASMCASTTWSSRPNRCRSRFRSGWAGKVRRRSVAPSDMRTAGIRLARTHSTR
jgi:alkanesulfonate monooxygenase SsuD/methylene tetrahydromethanopterin reductase-like flavin-dependent oxidoreductase (luciferase family)